MELHRVGELMTDARLVTLTGAGGSGKTRLALEAATRFAGHDGESAFVDLAPLAEPSLLGDHVAAALEVRPLPEQDATGALVATLKPRSLLLVLDNCEHLVDPCAELVRVLLHGCPHLRVLATSREPLGLAGECLWQVPPLSLPPPVDTDAANVSAADAVQLFTVRAREANPAFRLSGDNLPAVTSICRRLDGLPLALELAAARTRVLSVEQIDVRLDDAFRLLTTGGRGALPRHQTLRGTFDWSHALLSPAQQVLLRRLAVFAGTFSLEAVEGVCGRVGSPDDDLDPSEVLDALAALVDRSLVVLEDETDAARYRLLETVRQYASEHLRDTGEEERVARRHAHWYADLVEPLAPLYFGGQGPPELMRRLDREHDNLRHATDWAVQAEDGGDIALRLATAVHWYWFARGLFQEGWRRLNTALAHGYRSEPLLRARTAVATGSAAVWIGRPEAALAPVTEAVDTLRRSGEDLFYLAYGLTIRGALLLGSDPQAGHRDLAEAESHLPRLPRSVLHAFVAYWQGLTAQRLGDEEAARRAFTTGRAIGQALDSGPSIAHSTQQLGRLDRRAGRFEAARDHLAEALRLHAAGNDRWGVAQGLLEMAHVTRELGEPRHAVRMLAAARRQAEDVGVAFPDLDAAETARLAADLEADLGPAELAAETARGVLLGAVGVLDLLTPETDPALPHLPIAEPAMETFEDPAALAPLEVTALGPLRLCRDGEPVAAQGWSSPRTRELLVFLLLHPEGIGKQEIGLALWPEASAAKLRNAFHVALHRLRTALGDPAAVTVEAGRYRIAPEHVAAFDAPSFERLARRGLAMGRDEAALPALLAALELYRGELMAGEPVGEWCLELREAYRRLRHDALAAAGELLEAADRPAEAATVYRSWIADDDLHEPAYRRLMICLDDLDERSEALRVYRRLVEVLDREMGVEPDAETRQVAEQIERAARRSGPARAP